MKTKKFITGMLFILALAVCCLVYALLISGCTEKQLSLKDYRDTDFSFLGDFEYGRVKKQEAVATFDSVEELRASDSEALTENAYVRTNGYYRSGDMGGASYVISKEGTSGCVELRNGLYANFVADCCEIGKSDHALLNVKQFGAKADGVTADQEAINAAIAYAGENLKEGRTVIYLPAGEYRADNEILANDLQYVLIVGEGDDTVIFTDNGYKSWWEFFFACWRDENCFFANFKIEARESWGQNKYFRQLTLIDCNGCYLYNLTLNVPETAWDGVPFVQVDSKGQVVNTASIDKQYTNLTLYSGDKNITVDGCTMYQMSGTYRGANIGIMDFYERSTENITVTDCTLHDNARDEQVGIFTKSGAENSHIIGVNFTRNKVFTYPTPYKSIIGGRTMCFTVAYDNEVDGVNIEGNEFDSYTESKFMSFGSVKNCTVKNNKISVHVIANAGYFFDSSCKADGDVIIEGNDCYFTYVDSPAIWKCVSAGHLTFRNNNVVADCTIYKIADRLGVYEGNNFQMLGKFRTCGSATKFNYNTVVSYGEHVELYNKLFFIHSGDSTFTEDTVLEFVGNTVTDYTYYDGAKNVKVLETLGEINSTSIKELRVTDNVYNCPNYRYTSSEDYMRICWVRTEAKIKNFICENNDLQGANTVYGAEGGENTLREFNTQIPAPDATAVSILFNGGQTPNIEADGDTVTLTANRQDVAWFVFGDGATVEDGTVKCKDGGTVTVFAAATDGSGVYSSVTVSFVAQNAFGTVAIVITVLCVLAVIALAVGVVLICVKVSRKHQ